MGGGEYPWGMEKTAPDISAQFDPENFLDETFRKLCDTFDLEHGDISPLQSLRLDELGLEIKDILTSFVQQNQKPALKSYRIEALQTLEVAQWVEAGSPEEALEIAQERAWAWDTDHDRQPHDLEVAQEEEAFKAQRETVTADSSQEDEVDNNCCPHCQGRGLCEISFGYPCEEVK